jgi:hypothetical protein
LYAWSAWESFDCRILNVATTSSAVNGWPSWKRTFLRRLNVHVLALLVGFHEVASSGRTTAFRSA